MYENDKKAAIGALSKIDPWKPYGADLFNAIARVSISVAVEAIGIRRNVQTGELEVRLMQRPQNAPAYAGMWHFPGSFIRPGESEENVLKRLEKGEFKAPVRLISRIGWDNNPHEERGHVMHLLYLVEVDDLSDNKWFPIGNLPEPMVDHHRQVLIPVAVKAFKRSWRGKMSAVISLAYRFFRRIFKFLKH